MGGAATVAAYNSVSGLPLWSVAALPEGVFSSVEALTIDGGQLFIGGSFTAISGGAERGHLATPSTATGAVLSFDPMMNSSVLAMAMTSAGLAVGGQFTAHNATPRGHVAAVDLSTGRLLPWSPNLDGSVYALTHTSGTLFIGGAFDRVGSESRDGLAAVTLTPEVCCRGIPVPTTPCPFWSRWDPRLSPGVVSPRSAGSHGLASPCWTR